MDVHLHINHIKDNILFADGYSEYMNMESCCVLQCPKQTFVLCSKLVEFIFKIQTPDT